MGVMGQFEASKRAPHHARFGSKADIPRHSRLCPLLGAKRTSALGSQIALPPDQKLAAQLCSVRFQMTPNGIAAEDKIAIIKRLGRFPDKTDAVVMVWYKGVTGSYQRQMHGVPGQGGRPLPKVIRGYESRKRYL